MDTLHLPTTPCCDSGDHSETLRSGYTAKYYWGEGFYRNIVLSLTDVQENYFTNYTLVFENEYGNGEKYLFNLKKVEDNVNVGAIVGGVCGGVTVLVLINVITVLVIRGRKHKKGHTVNASSVAHSNAVSKEKY